MHEIDLIPADYRQARSQQRWLRLGALCVGGLLAGIMLARLAIEAGIAQERPAMMRLQREAQTRSAQRSALAALNEERHRLEARLQTLQRLREPAAWQPGLHSVDLAFSTGLWFDQLNFTQHAALAGQPAQALQAAQPAPGTGTAQPAPALQQTLEIRGHALDHAGVMGFIARLREQPSLRQVRLADTNVRRYAEAEVIDFSVVAQVVPADSAAPGAGTAAGAASAAGGPL